MGELKNIKIEQRNMAYKLEYQENHNIRQNLKIQGLPEAMQGEDLTDINL